MELSRSPVGTKSTEGSTHTPSHFMDLDNIDKDPVEGGVFNITTRILSKDVVVEPIGFEGT